MSDLDACYAILEVPSTASLEQIRASYRDLAMVWHPDRYQRNDHMRERAQLKMQEINLAYRTLRTALCRSSPHPRSSRPSAPAPSPRTPSPPPPAESGAAAPPVTLHGMSPAEARAFGWYAEAASRGDADSQMIIARMYSEGGRVAQDESKAAAWYREAAEQGYPPAQFQMGLHYHGGRGVPRSARHAVDWYDRAARGGYAKAQFYLGMIHSEGEDVPRDDLAAYAWFDVAAAFGHRDAPSLRDALARSMNADDLAMAVVQAQKLRADIRQLGSL